MRDPEIRTIYYEITAHSANRECMNERMNNEPGNVYICTCGNMKVYAVCGVAGFADASTITLHRNSVVQWLVGIILSRIVVQLYLRFLSTSSKTRKTFLFEYTVTHIHPYIYICVVLDQIKYFGCFSYWTTSEMYQFVHWIVCDSWLAGWLACLIRIQATEQTFIQNSSQKSRFNLYFCHCSALSIR